jgi:hypothetical protein
MKCVFLTMIHDSVCCLQVNGSLNGPSTLNPNKPVPSLALSFTSGTGVGGWSNRGIGNEGMSLVGGSPYEGYVFVLAPSGCSLFIGLNDYVKGEPLASKTVPVAASMQWQQVRVGHAAVGALQLIHGFEFAHSFVLYSLFRAYSLVQISFTLTPSASTPCVGIQPGSNSNIDCGKRARSHALLAFHPPPLILWHCCTAGFEAAACIFPLRRQAWPEPRPHLRTVLRRAAGEELEPFPASCK